MSSDIFLKIDDINGESIDSKYKNAINIINWGLNFRQSGSMHTGLGGGSGKVDIQNISIKHRLS